MTDARYVHASQPPHYDNCLVKQGYGSGCKCEDIDNKIIANPIVPPDYETLLKRAKHRLIEIDYVISQIIINPTSAEVVEIANMIKDTINIANFTGLEHIKPQEYIILKKRQQQGGYRSFNYARKMAKKIFRTGKNRR